MGQLDFEIFDLLGISATLRGLRHLPDFLSLLLRLLLFKELSTKVGDLNALILNDGLILSDFKLKVLDLRSQGLYQHRVRVSVDDRLILNVSSSACVLKSTQRFIVVELGRGDTGDHRGSRVTSQGVLKDSGELGVSVWDVIFTFRAFALCQGADDLTEA